MIRVQTFERKALDWAVAECEDLHPTDTHIFTEDWPDGLELELYGPSTRWAIGGPILDKTTIELHRRDDPIDCWAAFAGDGTQIYAVGPTRLIAAMRCYVIVRLGEFVHVPASLVSAIVEVEAPA